MAGFYFYPKAHKRMSPAAKMFAAGDIKVFSKSRERL